MKPRSQSAGGRVVDEIPVFLGPRLGVFGSGIFREGKRRSRMVRRCRKHGWAAWAK
jgi:hypothetical protein